MNKPDILIIIPTLGKRMDYLKQTIESIRAQTYQGFDIAFIYPLENKAMSQLADSLKAIKIADPGGLSAALNAGVAAAKAHHKYISWIGDDDLLTPHSLATAKEALEQNPRSVIAYGYCDYIDQNGQFIFKSQAGSLAPWIMTWGPNLLPLPGVLFVKEFIINAGGFDEHNKYSMDLDIFLRLRKLGKFVNTKQTLAAFRWHPDSMSVASRDKAQHEAEAVKQKYLPWPLARISPIWLIPLRHLSNWMASKISKKVNQRSV